MVFHFVWFYWPFVFSYGGVSLNIFDIIFIYAKIWLISVVFELAPTPLFSY
jgi:hypothetical protein